MSQIQFFPIFRSKSFSRLCVQPRYSCRLALVVSGGTVGTQKPPANLVYPRMAIEAIVGALIQTDTPTVAATVATNGVSPGLPAGLNLNGSTGAILPQRWRRKPAIRSQPRMRWIDDCSRSDCNKSCGADKFGLPPNDDKCLRWHGDSGRHAH